MRILSLTAGAASMYCGSCLRDNALAAELMRRGHDVTLLPFYTPTLTDEPNVSRQKRVFFGGISVYLQQHLSLFRHTPHLVDRLWDAPRVISALAGGAIAVDPKQLGALTVSTLRGEDGHQRKEIEKLLSWVVAEPRPDVVNIPYTLLIALAAPLRRALGCPIVVTLQGEDLFLDGLPEPFRTQALDLIRSQIAHVDRFIAVSDYYATFMREYLSIPLEKMRVARIGVNTSDLAITPALSETVVSGRVEGSRRRQDPFTIGYFARVAPEKGLHNLIEAYRVLRQERGVPRSRLLAAGYLAPEHRSYLDGLERQLESWGLGDEFEYRGAVERAAKVAFFHGIDVLSVPSGYHEPKGLYVLEAMACGVPVVQPAHGAFPEIIGRTHGGVLARSEAGTDVADALYEVWRNPEHAAALGRNGAAGVRAQYTVGHMAEQTLAVFEESINTHTGEANRVTR
ncbi:MAG: glycosyltransferase family 4 protein [Vicinamibacterales bacterium]